MNWLLFALAALTSSPPTLPPPWILTVTGVRGELEVTQTARYANKEYCDQIAEEVQFNAFVRNIRITDIHCRREVVV